MSEMCGIDVSWTFNENGPEIYFQRHFIIKKFSCDYFVCKHTKMRHSSANNVAAMALCMDDIYIYGNDIEVKAIHK